MADQVDEVKQKTDIVSVINEHVDLKKAGRNYKALCPFHSEKTPSFMVSPELQIYKCFGCGESGDSYAFLQKYEGMDFPEALKFLAERAGVKLKEASFKDREGRQKLYRINSLAGKLYQYFLLKHQAGKAALNYLKKERGLRTETIKEFGLGFSPGRSGVISKFLVDKKGYKKDEIEKVGIIFQRGREVIDRLKGRIIFPLHDHRGNAVGFSGRLMPGNESMDAAKYINTPETLVYHKSGVLYALNKTRTEIKRKGYAIVTEGELDVITSWQAGFKNIVAIKGSAFTPDQARLLSRFCQEVVLALDADLAGDTAARRGINVAEAAGLEVKIAKIEGFKDPDEMVRENADLFKKAISNAVGVWDFIIDSVFSLHDVKTAEGKAKISREVIPILFGIQDEIVKAHFVQVVAKKLNVPTEAVIEQIEKHEAKSEVKGQRVEDLVKGSSKSRRQLLEERLMSISFSSNPEALLEKDTISLFETPLAKRILEKYQDYPKKNKTFDPSEFAEDLPKELVDGFAELILKSDLDSENLSDQKKEIKLIERELRVLTIKNKLTEMAKLMRKYEEKKQKSKLMKTEKEFSKLTEKLSELEEKEFGGIIL